MKTANPSRMLPVPVWMMAFPALGALLASFLLRSDISGQTWRVFVTLFLSIVMEAFPFLILGSAVAALIHLFVSADALRRVIPASGVWRYFAVGLAGLVFPICECGIVPIARSLVKKGVPASVAVTFMAAVPVVNPLVGLSTYIAFNGNLRIAMVRMGLAFVVAVLAGLMLALFGIDQKPVLHREPAETEYGCAHSNARGFGGFFGAMAEELAQTGRFLILGAALAAAFQVAVPRAIMAGLGQNVVLGTGSMMGFAYLSSLCSEADAFVAAAFRGILPLGALMGFLVFGPMMDIKNTLLLLSGFRRPFVKKTALALTALTLAVCIGFSAVG